MVNRRCPICNSDDESDVYAEADFDIAKLNEFAFASRKLPEYMHYRLITCSKCDLLYANPLPEMGVIADAYEDASFDSGVEAEFASRTYADSLPRIQKRLSDMDGALDIGTGDGAFLEKLLQGGFTSVFGVEPSSAPIEAAKPEIKPLIRKGLFDSKDFDSDRFQLISCFQTIEHLYDPFAMTKEMYKLLKTGGAVYIICHNRESFVNRALKFKSPIFDIEHLQLFSPNSIKSLLKESGFENVEVFPIVNKYPLSYWFKLFPLPEKIKQALLRFLNSSKIGNLPISIPVGNMAAIGYKIS